MSCEPALGIRPVDLGDRGARHLHGAEAGPRSHCILDAVLGGDGCGRARRAGRGDGHVDGDRALCDGEDDQPAGGDPRRLRHHFVEAEVVLFELYQSHQEGGTYLVVEGADTDAIPDAVATYAGRAAVRNQVTGGAGGSAD